MSDWSTSRGTLFGIDKSPRLTFSILCAVHLHYAPRTLPRLALSIYGLLPAYQLQGTLDDVAQSTWAKRPEQLPDSPFLFICYFIIFLIKFRCRLARKWVVVLRFEAA